jgi:DNA-binding transcriptional LysR family regulator
MAIAESGSVRAAADLLGLSQPAVSKSLRALEAELGVALIQRGARGSTLTAFGNVLYARAKVIGNEIERVTGELRQMAGTAAGRIALGASATASVILLPGAIQAFRAGNPRIRVEVVGGLPILLLPRLADGSIDLLVGPRPTQALPAHISASKLFTTSSVIAVRRGHPLEKARHLIDFAGADWVLNSSAGHANSELHSAFMAIGVAEVRTALYADSLYAAYALIAKTNYVGLLPRLILNDSIVRDVLSIVDVPEFLATDSIELFFRANAPLSSAAMKLTEILQREGRRARQGE